MTVDFGTRLNQQAQGSALQIRNTLKIYREACQLVIRMYDQSWNANTAEFDLVEEGTFQGRLSFVHRSHV